MAQSIGVTDRNLRRYEKNEIHTINGKPLHVVVGMDDALVWLITAYYPSLDIWESDFMSRKGVD